MTHLIGQDYIDRFTVVDSEGTLLTGLTFIADQTWDPNGATFTVTVTEIGTGMYQVSWPITLSGVYYARLQTISLTPFQVFEFQVHTDDIEVEETVTHYFTIRDDDGNYFGGAPITVSLAVDPGGSTFVPIVTDLANGLYRVSWDATSEGVYTLRLAADLSSIGDDDQLFQFEMRVFPAAITVSPLEPVVGDTLDDLVRAVALLCGDILDTTVTEDAADATTWQDELTLSATSPKKLKGSNLYVVSASADQNVAREARVLDSTDHGLVLSHPLASPPRRGDRGYLVNLESNGFQRQRYVNCINDRIRDAFPLYLIPAVWTFGVDDDTFFDANAPYLTPPAAFTHIWSVDYPSAGYSPYETDIPIGNADSSGWWWDDAEGRIVIGGIYRTSANGVPVRLRGYGRHPILESASDQCGVDRKWLVEMSAGTLIISLRDQRRLPEGQNHINRADAWMSAMSTNVHPNTVRIR
jgi:hypothetical protein